MELFTYFQIFWKQKILILVFSFTGVFLADIGTYLQFEPHFIGEYQFTVQLQGEASRDARNSDWFTSTIQGWLNSAELRQDIDFPFQVKKTSWQNLIINFVVLEESTLNLQKGQIAAALRQEISRFNLVNDNLLQISNEYFTFWPAQIYLLRNGIFGALLGLLLGMIISLFRAEV